MKTKKEPFNFTITDELRGDYVKFLRGETDYAQVKIKHGISHYQITKLFDMMYVEKRKQSTL